MNWVVSITTITAAVVSITTITAALPVAFALLRVLATYLRSYFIYKMTVLYDIPNIGKPRSDDGRIKGSAVICGGSIAGLLAARICADHFEDVVVIEPEAWLSTEEGRSDVYDEMGNRAGSRGLRPRTRVSQYRAIHVYQSMALAALRRLFPCFDDEIRRLDGRISKADYNVQIYGKPAPVPAVIYPDETYSQCFYVTRESYERALRRLVIGYSKRIHWVVGTATGVKPDDDDPTLLTSVIVRSESGDERIIPASLIIDCTGGSQAGLKWLRRIYTDPQISANLYRQSVVPKGSFAFDENLRIDYNTRHRYRKFRIFVPPEIRSRLPIPCSYDEAAWLYTYLPHPDWKSTVIMIARFEGHRIEWSLVKRGEVPLPETFSDVKVLLGEVEKQAHIPHWVHDLADVLLEIEGEYETELGRYPSASWIRYERAPYVPSNFIAIGDAVMVVNPMYGQGCSKAAIGAITIDHFLRRQSTSGETSLPRDFGRTFFKLHSSRIASTWNGTKPADYQSDTTVPIKGERLSDERFRGKFGLLLAQLASTDKDVNSAVWHVRTFLAPPTDLMHPLILAKVLLLYVRERMGWT